MQNKNIRSIIDLQNGRAVKCTTGGIRMNKRTETVSEMTNEEYRDGIISIFMNMDRADKLRFWYRYISAIENGED